MKLTQLLLPTIALGAAAVMVVPAQDASAWALLGHKLNIAQRDFRVFNNFTDSTANNNNTPDANFPGYQGAVMAIWKGCVEWGSTSHGNGAGDPSQSVLGSGGANFDPAFQGLAIEVGTGNSNTHSELSGSSGGTLAFMEGGSNGWRIRYYRGWTWDDGPGTSFPGNRIDLQGVACHEYGHATGMGHSGASGATMRPSISGTGTGQRSINSDDIAGIQANYGAADALKPVITALNVTGNQIQIDGSNFDPTGNEVWFTQAGSGGDGIPIKVTNVTSNGTQVTVTIPAAAGPGDVLVRKNGTGNKALSNAWPSDLQSSSSCLTPSSYCTVSPNSVGSGAVIGFSGTASLSANNLELIVFGCPANKPALFFYGPTQISQIFGNGVRCAGGAINRLQPQSTDSIGFATQLLDLNAAPFNAGTGAAGVGVNHNFQFWYRDPAAGGAAFNTSDGLSVTYCP